MTVVLHHLGILELLCQMPHTKLAVEAEVGGGPMVEVEEVEAMEAAEALVVTAVVTVAVAAVVTMAEVAT